MRGKPQLRHSVATIITLTQIEGYAVGVMGMSRADFCRMSPLEFYHVSKAHREEQERLSRERWEIMRMEALIMIQPHIKDRITPKKLLPFPWDKTNGRTNTEETMTLEDRKRRAEDALKKWG